MYFKLNIIVCMGLLVSLFSISCSLIGNPPGKTELVDMRVNHYRQTAIGEGPVLVYLMQEEDDIGNDDWSYLYDGVEGFNFEPGYIYDLKVRKIDIDNPPADGSSLQYILVNVRSKEKVPEDESFDIHLKAFGYNFVRESNNEMSLLNEYLIHCDDLCESLSSDLQNKEEVTGTFIHGPEETLVLQDIK